MNGNLTKEEIIPLINRVLDLKQPYREAVEELREKTQVRNIELYLDILNGDQGVKHVAERIALAQISVPKLDRAGLIALVEKIMTAQGSEAEIHTWADWFKANISHPAGTDLIFYPAKGKEEPTAEEIVDEALSYKEVLEP